MTPPDGVTILGPMEDRFDEVLTDDALAFVADLHRRFEATRRELLRARAARQARVAAGEPLAFPAETREVREGSWRVAAPRVDLQERLVEITGPTDRKMMINALNSGADGFMADHEDANSPTWRNMVGGQVNLQDAVRREITFTKPDGTVYELDDETATLLVRPRGWHLTEPRLRVDSDPVAGGLMDLGLYLFHNGRELLRRGTGPYFYLPKLEGYLEARLWDQVLRYGEDTLGLPRGTARATVLIETLPAAFEMEEILYELREHSAGLNAGRWDYIFSVIKTFRGDPTRVLPDRGAITMTVPFMRAYTGRLVQVCHRRGAHAMGGMAAFIPSRDPELNARAFDAVRTDKEREARAGFDGTWVAHPGLVAVARGEFEGVLAGAPNQVQRQRDDFAVTAEDLVALAVPDGVITLGGLRQNVGVGVRYLESWLRGQGAAGIFNLMEDTATAEISRTQVWQWTHHGATLSSGEVVTRDLVRSVMKEELETLRRELGADAYEARPFDDARELFEEVALGDDFVEFLTLPGADRLASTTPR